MKNQQNKLIGLTLAFLSMLICSSCTSMLMDSGARPWELYGQPKSAVTDAYGKPVMSGQKHEQLDEALQTRGNLRSTWTTYTHFGVHQIRGPFPEPDVTKSLEALYASVFTLGLAEIVMLPPTAITKFRQRNQTRPFAFLYDGEDITVGITGASTNLLSILEKENDENANKGIQPTK